MKRNYWKSHPEKLEFLISWYPHWGAEPLANELNVDIKTIQNKAGDLKLNMIRAREKRRCYYCRVNFIGKHKKFGLRCTECFKPYRADKRRALIDKNPVKERLRDIAYQINSRNRRKGAQDKISEETLLSLWKHQDGRCAYTGRKMLASSGTGGDRNPDTLSVDRINPRQRYSNSNIILCTWWANAAKHDLDVFNFVERCREVVLRANVISRKFEKL